MKRPDDRRLWIDRLGVRMEEPRVRYVINTTQVMTSTEYDGDYRPEFYDPLHEDHRFKDLIERMGLASAG